MDQLISPQTENTDKLRWSQLPESSSVTCRASLHGFTAMPAIELRTGGNRATKNTSAKSTATLQFEELVDLDSTLFSETVSKDGTVDLTPKSNDRQPANSIPSDFDREERIPRNPGDSVPDASDEKQFSQSRLDQLFDRWDSGADAFWKSYRDRCEIVYEIQKETAKPGCKGAFSAALRRIRLSDSTAYDMVKRHRIRIGEILDPAALDPRDEVEGTSLAATDVGAKGWDDLPKRGQKIAFQKRNHSVGNTSTMPGTDRKLHCEYHAEQDGIVAAAPTKTIVATPQEPLAAKLRGAERYAAKKAKRLAEEKAVTDAKVARELARCMALPVTVAQVANAKRIMSTLTKWREVINELHQYDAECVGATYSIGRAVNELTAELERVERDLMQPHQPLLESPRGKEGSFLPVAAMTDPEAIHMVATHMNSDEARMEALEDCEEEPWTALAQAGG